MGLTEGKSRSWLGNGDGPGHRTAVRIGDGQRITPCGQAGEIFGRGTIAPGIGVGGRATVHGHINGPARTAETAHVDMRRNEGQSRGLGNGHRLRHRTAIGIGDSQGIIPCCQSREVFGRGTVVPHIGVGNRATVYGHIDGPVRTAETAHVDMGSSEGKGRSGLGDRDGL